MNKTFLSVALFFGVFAIAYGGFFYQKYTSSQESPDTATTIETSAQMIVSSSRNKNQHPTTKIITTNIDDQNTKPSEPINAVSSRTTKQKTPAHNKPGRSSYTVDNTENNGHDLVTYNSRPGRDYSVNKLSATSYTAPANNNVSPTSLFTTSDGTANNISTVSDKYSNTDARQTTSIITSSDSSNSTTESSTNDSVLPAASGTVNDVVTPETEQWATQNCPLQLASGSTKADADAMRQTYGCRYLEYCQSLNDGKNGVKCWWGFYSS